MDSEERTSDPLPRFPALSRELDEQNYNPRVSHRLGGFGDWMRHTWGVLAVIAFFGFIMLGGFLLIAEAHSWYLALAILAMPICFGVRIANYVAEWRQ